MRTSWLVLGFILSCATSAHAGIPPYTDLSQEFARIADDTASMDPASRAVEARRRLTALFPGFYEPRDGVDPAGYEAQVARALQDFAALRPRYVQAQREFPIAYAAALQHFREFFPDFAPAIPVYFLHSLGEMDGGTRDLLGKSYLVFGADVIARIHGPQDIGPFIDHELFHVENARYFASCEAVWCGLWSEGLATYAAHTMNPQADDRQLLLTLPKPLRGEVDAQWTAALCFTKAKLQSTASADYDAFFVGGGENTGQFPQRFGYYVGFRLMQEAGRHYRLRALAQMPLDSANAVLASSLDALISRAGGCAPLPASKTR